MAILLNNSSCHKPLIYDIGMYKGEDTLFYLKKGYNVIAIEANPYLCRRNKLKFKKQIDSGSLVIIEGAISEIDSDECKIFICKNMPIWSTTNINLLNRIKGRTIPAYIKPMSVPVIKLADIISKYGLPYYMKIDIEGAETQCLNVLKKMNARPRFLSIESNKFDFQQVINEFKMLSSMGYHNFSIIQQQTIPLSCYLLKNLDNQTFFHRFKLHSSGRFGNDLPHQFWLNEQQAIAKYQKIFREYKKYGDNTLFQKNIALGSLLYLFSFFLRKGLPGWYDTHARLCPTIKDSSTF